MFGLVYLHMAAQYHVMNYYVEKLANNALTLQYHSGTERERAG